MTATDHDGTPAEPFANYQNELYLAGLADQLPPFTTDLTALQSSARERMAPGPFWYVAGAAGSGATDRANRDAFARWRIVPRMLRDATERDLRTIETGDPELLELFDLEWRLDEISQYATWFQRPHTGSADDEVALVGMFEELGCD